ncbi:hypothetical protein KDAU_51270 [Dictyobacter aurantiacus]|uniref:Uncharacterized protein n=1 Tax=Dictyobacter aurantiacus TaxID=1936993 RepID=A0A401ZLU2_9CHLR|nr:hypothetical protein KDAU_51270 [Dictyobacter aurantiacus]
MGQLFFLHAFWGDCQPCLLLKKVVDYHCYEFRSSDSLPLRKSKHKRYSNDAAETGKARLGIVDGASNHGAT